MSDPAIEVTENRSEHRYDITVDGEQAGFSAYRDVESRSGSADQRILYHTVVEDSFEGRGLASQLTRGAIEQAVAQGYRIVPLCPYVKNWVQKHAEYADSIDAVTPDHLALFS